MAHYEPDQWRVRLRVERLEEPSDQYRLESPHDVADFIINATRVQQEPQEVFGVVFMGGRNQVEGFTIVARGGLNAVAMNPREVFRTAIIAGAKAIVLFHNHPSGDKEPSEEDLAFTKRIREVGKIVGTEVLDHLVISATGDWTSLRERGHFA